MRKLGKAVLAHPQFLLTDDMVPARKIERFALHRTVSKHSFMCKVL